jgi:hypothetical protein
MNLFVRLDLISKIERCRRSRPVNPLTAPLLVPGHPLQIKWIRRKELNILERTAIAIVITRLLARFPNAQISDPNFIPAYGGAVGELRLQSLPMQIH